MQISINLDDGLSEKLNQRLPRSVKIAVLGRWLLRAIVLTPKELEVICKNNSEEANVIGPFLQEAMSKLYEAAATEKEGKNGKK